MKPRNGDSAAPKNRLNWLQQAKKSVSGLKTQRTTLVLAAAVMVGSFTPTAEAALSDYHDADYFDRYNPTPDRFNNTRNYGFDSNGRTNPNAIQMRGETTRVSNVPLYDNQGRRLKKGGRDFKTKSGNVGLYNGRHDGKLQAAAWCRMNINGRTYDMVYLNSVPIDIGGTHSGWVVARNIRPSKIVDAVRENYGKRERDSVRHTRAPRNSDYRRHSIKNQSTPSHLRGGYVVPNRSSSAGIAEYYYIRDGVVNGFYNLPETGNKRHGVQCSRSAPGENFWRDTTVREYTQNIFKRNSRDRAGTFRWAFGHTITSGGTRIYCWVNRDCLN